MTKRARNLVQDTLDWVSGAVSVIFSSYHPPPFTHRETNMQPYKLSQMDQEPIDVQLASCRNNCPEFLASDLQTNEHQPIKTCQLSTPKHNPAIFIPRNTNIFSQHGISIRTTSFPICMPRTPTAALRIEQGPLLLQAALQQLQFAWFNWF